MKKERIANGFGVSGNPGELEEGCKLSLCYHSTLSDSGYELANIRLDPERVQNLIDMLSTYVNK